MSDKFSLVTGASQGIGRAMGEQLAIRKHNLLLVALPDSGLEETAAYFSDKYGVKVLMHTTDLSIENNIEETFAWYKSLNIEIDILINNAGRGYSGRFHESPEGVIQTLLNLNNHAMVMMSRLFIPELIKNEKSHILNVGSMESFIPLPYKSVYTGTKHFVYGFSLALREELRNQNIKVSVLCPGPVPTNEEGMKRYIAQGWKSKVLSKMPDEVAKIAIESMFKGKNVIIPGPTNRFVNTISRVVPTGLKMRILEKIFRIYVE